MEHVEHIPADVKQRILEYILSYTASHGYSPTIREISQDLGLKGTATPQKYVNELIRERRLERDARRSRTLRIVV